MTHGGARAAPIALSQPAVGGAVSRCTKQRVVLQRLYLLHGELPTSYPRRAAHREVGRAGAGGALVDGGDLRVAEDVVVVRRAPEGEVCVIIRLNL